MLARDDTDVISRLPRLEELSERLPEGVLAEIVEELINKDSADQPQTPFQNYV
jgi:hypothetical protein